MAGSVNIMLGTILTLSLSLLGGSACPLPDPRAGMALDFNSIEGFVLTEGDEEFLRFAPILLVEGYDQTYNRVGMPAARYDGHGDELVYVDPSAPVYYLQKITWKGERGTYTNLIYRTHFESSAGNDNSTNGGKGTNVGMLTIVTLNEAGQPLWVNTVGTCGCFHAVLPTSFLPAEAYPSDWNAEHFKVYGENLPGRLNYPADFDQTVRPVVYLRAGSHRVADVQVASMDSVKERYSLHDAKSAPMDSLKHLSLGDQKETSFYYEEGSKKGLVKGAFKKREAFLLSAVVGDSRVGQDRIYGPPEELPRGFYTTINPLEKSDSDMWDYKAFLEQNGWKP